MACRVPFLIIDGLVLVMLRGQTLCGCAGLEYRLMTAKVIYAGLIERPGISLCGFTRNPGVMHLTAAPAMRDDNGELLIIFLNVEFTPVVANPSS
jgi:hypothetical protein